MKKEIPVRIEATAEQVQALGVGGGMVTRGVGYFIHTLEGEHRVSEGDMVIKGVKGEFYPCKPDIFELTYEKVDE